ncbi:hypothetical protein TWF281_009121 [Arthrobotrys megalospora]
MGGIGAPAVAGSLELWGDLRLGRAAEWLHRSAYSFGGPDQPNGLGASPDDSQKMENLVFGTYEANTEMIRYEAYLKRLVHHNICRAVELRTSTVDSTGQYPWFAKELNYAWLFRMTLPGWDNPVVPRRQHTFDLFERKHLTLCEFSIDEFFDRCWTEGYSYLGVGNGRRLNHRDLQTIVLMIFIGQDDPNENPEGDEAGRYKRIDLEIETKSQVPEMSIERGVRAPEMSIEQG